MQRYKYTVCGYTYDPENGDPDSGVESGPSFEDLPTIRSALYVGLIKTLLRRSEGHARTGL